MDPHEMEPSLTQKLAEIGACLREARQAKQTSLEEISGQTMIPARLLSAIEEGRVDNLPETIYTRGFIRRFGDSVGLNGTQLAAAYAESGQATALSAAAKAKNRKLGLKGGLRPVHLYVLYIVLIMSAGVGLSYLTNSTAVTSTKTPTETTAVSSPTQEAPAPDPKQTQDPPNISAKPVAAPVADLDKVRIDLSIKEASWLEIIVDGKVNYEGTLTPGTNKTVVAKQQLVITAGNAGGVMLAVNQKPAQLMGERGAIKELKLEPKPLAGQST